VTLRLPASAQGQTVDVGFRPPGWWAELGAWALALLAGAAWSVAAAVHRRRSEPDARISRQNGLKQ
jgi:hypothetical protein